MVKTVLEANHSPVIRIVRFFRENKSARGSALIPVADSSLPATVFSEAMSGQEREVCFPEFINRFCQI